ncbi:hypothetical protein SeMB42_g03631 [Synchytrium endobioticum]|uniref:RNA polymerase II elongation factor ELL N-terminal domain-containing protein n=1 Tax=Synchytrium endobioticum TaxID=286115 RepID=A0A507D359_9FUNG|nr:hypothetical protein SeLEV6574_g03672 [Synchytrium endobioticum]TPX46597.1 hypothetical protein SeMB42_g03631 [Synchytrium endobioticum]
MSDSPSPTSTSTASPSSSGHATLSLSSNDFYDIVIPPESQSRRIIHLRLSDDVVKQLHDQADDVELSFDFNPSIGRHFLVLNDEGHELSPAPARYFSECYRQTDTSRLEYLGPVTHIMSIKSGLDDRKKQEVKQKTLQASEQKRARRIAVITDSELKKAGRQQGNSLKLKGLSHITKDRALVPSAAARQRVTSTPGWAATSSLLSPAPPAKRDEDLRKRMIELLAAQPYQSDELAKRLGTDESNIRAELLSMAEKVDGAYELKNESYREVDPYQCRWYDHPTRKRVIERAKIALDALGVTHDAPERRRLSPPASPIIPHPPQPPVIRKQEEETGNLSSSGASSDANMSSSNTNTSKAKKREETPDSSTEQQKVKRVKRTSFGTTVTKRKEAEKKNKPIFQGQFKNHSVSIDGASNSKSIGAPVNVENVTMSGTRAAAPPQSASPKPKSIGGAPVNVETVTVSGTPAAAPVQTLSPNPKGPTAPVNVENVTISGIPAAAPPQSASPKPTGPRAPVHVENVTTSGTLAAASPLPKGPTVPVNVENVTMSGTRAAAPPQSVSPKPKSIGGAPVNVENVTVSGTAAAAPAQTLSPNPKGPTAPVNVENVTTSGILAAAPPQSASPKPAGPRAPVNVENGYGSGVLAAVPQHGDPFEKHSSTSQTSKLGSIFNNSSSNNSTDSNEKTDVRKLEQVKPLPSLENMTSQQLTFLFESKYKAHETIYTEICNLAQTAQRMHEKMVKAGFTQATKNEVVKQPSAATSSGLSEVARDIDMHIAQCRVDGVRVTFNQNELRGLLSAAVAKYEKLREQVGFLKSEVERRGNQR